MGGHWSSEPAVCSNIGHSCYLRPRGGRQACARVRRAAACWLVLALCTVAAKGSSADSETGGPFAQVSMVHWRVLTCKFTFFPAVCHPKSRTDEAGGTSSFCDLLVHVEPRCRLDASQRLTVALVARQHLGSCSRHAAARAQFVCSGGGGSLACTLPTTRPPRALATTTCPSLSSEFAMDGTRRYTCRPSNQLPLHSEPAPQCSNSSKSSSRRRQQHTRASRFHTGASSGSWRRS